MISKEISSMIQTYEKLAKNSGRNMTHKAIVFGNYTMSFMKVKEKLVT